MGGPPGPGDGGDGDFRRAHASAQPDFVRPGVLRVSAGPAADPRRGRDHVSGESKTMQHFDGIEQMRAVVTVHVAVRSSSSSSCSKVTEAMLGQTEVEVVVFANMSSRRARMYWRWDGVG